MALTATSSEKKTFLSIGFGKLRQKSVNGSKVVETTPDAVWRKSEKSTNGSWAIEYDKLVGKIVGLYYKEDKEYGNRYEVTFSDGGELYQVSFKDDSLGFIFMKKLPNINFDLPVELSCYPDFVASNGKKVMAGINLVQSGQKVISAYETKNAKGEWEYLLGFPKPAEDMDWKDKDDRDAYNIKIKKFFKSEYNNKWKPKFEEAKSTTAPTVVDEAPLPTDNEDEVPF